MSYSYSTTKKGFNLQRFISDIIPLIAVVIVYFSIIDLSGIEFLTRGQFELFPDLTLYFLLGLALLLIIDFLVYGPPSEITGIIFAICATLCLQNYIIGVILGFLNLLLLATVGQIKGKEY